MALTFLAANNASTTLAGAITPTSTSLSVVGGTGALFPVPSVGNSQFRLTMVDAATGAKREIMYVTATSTDTFTVLRAQEGTAALAWLAGDTAGNFFTSGEFTNLTQIAQVQAGGMNFAVGAGTGNAITASLNPAPTALVSGLIARVKVLSSNTTAVTLALNNFGAIQVVGEDGLPVVPSALIAGTIYQFMYDGSRWVVTNRPIAPFYAVDSSVTASVVTITTPVPLAAYYSAMILIVKVANTNVAGGTTVNVNGLGAVPVFAQNGQVLVGGVFQAGSTYIMMYTGSAFIAAVPNNPPFAIGEIRMWTPPTGTTNANLAAAITAAWGFGWHLANGTVGTVNLEDRFVIGAGNLYAGNATGGAATSVIAIGNLPAHSHGVSDPGHNHGMNDPGHTHYMNDPGHNHYINDPGHNHGQSVHSHGFIDPGHAHVIQNGAVQVSGLAVGAGYGPYNYGSGSNNQTEIAGTGASIQAQYANINAADTGIYNSASGTGVYLSGALTGVYNSAAATGITTANTGGGAALPTLPPYYALAFVQFTGA